MKAVDIQGVHQRIAGMTILQDLNLSLHEGEVLGLFGHNGAGKTTSMKLILGLLTPSEGRVEVLGGQPQDLEVRRQLGYLPENVTFYPQLTGRETLAHFARLRGAAPQQVAVLLDQVGLGHAADRRVKTYSKGMRQRLGLAQALLGEPRLLLLDEPTVGLDPIATHELYQLIDRLRQGGTSIILCSHALAGVEAHLNRVAILAAGRLQAVGDLAQLRADTGLPVRMRVHGLADGNHWRDRWQGAGHQTRLLDAQSLEVVVHNGHKLALLRELLRECEPGDIEVHQPSLEDLYCHYMARADQANRKEVQP